MDAYRELERAVGAAAMASLAARGLVSRAPMPAVAPGDGAVIADRTAGVMFGLAAGSAAPSGRVGIEAETFVLAAERLFDRIGALRARGWTFVFLGANQDSYGAGDAVGLQAGNVTNFQPDAHGVAAAYVGLSRSVSEWRGKSRLVRRRDRDDFWGGRKEAEER